jgi:hypothetical protein
MRRLFWLGAGAAGGVYLSHKVRRATERVMPPGLADQLLAWGAGLRVLAEDVRAGTTEREAVLRQTLGLAELPERRPLLPAAPERRRYPDVA